MSVETMPLPKDLSEAIGQVVINAIAEAGLVRVSGHEGVVFVWAANAAEQIGETVRRRFACQFRGRE